jgi:hypothetical protein
MSDTPIAPSVGAAALAGVAAAMGLAISSPQGAAGMTGVAPSLTAVGAQASLGGLPVSWTNLGAGAVGAATPLMQWQQARFQISGQLGQSYGNLIIQGSRDNVTWTNLVGVNDPVAPGYRLYGGFGGLRIHAPGNGLIVLGVTDSMDRFKYLRPVVQGGDGVTLVSISGNISTVGCV